MLDRFKKWFQSQESKSLPPIIITIHGYGRRRNHEMDNLALWGAKDGWEVVQFDMFDIFDETDCDWMKWVNRAKAKVDYYIMQKREIYLVGFSMGGVIASYLASVCPIKRLVLIAPAFHYLHVENITNVITKSAASWLSNEKKEKDEIELPKSFYSGFTNTIKELRRYVEDITCPVLLLHGDEDEIIPLRSSTWAFDKITHSQKRLIILHGGHHRLLMDEAVNWEVYQMIHLFLNEILIPEGPIEQSPDYLDELKRQVRAQNKKDRTLEITDEKEKEVEDTMS